MILYPAIDLKDGQCVRLVHGYMDQATVFNDDAGDQAKQFADAGAEWIHVVDLNGAFEGRPVNLDAVKRIIDSVDVKIQLGGGIRNMDKVDEWLGAGINRVILGTAAVKDPEFVKAACKKYPGQIVVGIDARGGFVATDGWAKTSELGVIELAQAYEGAGVAAIIYTDVDRDGAMGGPNIQNTQALAKAVNIPVIASGGVSSMADLAALKPLTADGLEGAISGRAIYDGAIDVAEAIELLKS